MQEETAGRKSTSATARRPLLSPERKRKRKRKRKRERERDHKIIPPD